MNYVLCNSRRISRGICRRYRFFPGTKVYFETLEEAYKWAEVPIEQGSIVIFATDTEEDV